MSDSLLTDAQKEVLVGVGAAIVAAQHTERVLDFCVTYVLQIRGALTIENLRKQSLSKRTLGQILSALQERVCLEERFERHLIEYLEKRNALIHDTRRIDGWFLNSDEGIATAHAFLGRLFALDKLIQRVLVGLIRAWLASLPADVTFPPFPDLPEIDDIPEEVLDYLFFKKE